MPFLFVRDDICRHPETMRTKIGSVSGRDVRHLCPGPSRSLVKMAHISGGGVGSPAWGVLSGFPGLSERVFK